jgi:hypothetical protein
VSREIVATLDSLSTLRALEGYVFVFELYVALKVPLRAEMGYAAGILTCMRLPMVAPMLLQLIERREYSRTAHAWKRHRAGADGN